MTTEVSTRGTGKTGATGRIVQVTGPVVDIEFPADRLPDIYNAIEITLQSDRLSDTICHSL